MISPQTIVQSPSGRTLAIVTRASEAKENTEWFGKESEALQGSRMSYNSGKTFRTHKHKLNPRIINVTQEAFIVIKGKIKVEIFTSLESHEEKTVLNFVGLEGISLPKALLLGTLVAGPGDAIFVWGGYHKISILEDNTVAYEIKAGQFTSVEEDKEFLDV